MSTEAFELSVIDCHEIGNTCTDGFLGAQLGNSLWYNANWEPHMVSLFAANPHILTTNPPQPDYVLPENPAVHYKNDTVGSFFMNGGTLTASNEAPWSNRAKSVRYTPKEVDPLSGLDIYQSEYEVDDVLLLKFKISNFRTPSQVSLLMSATCKNNTYLNMHARTYLRDTSGHKKLLS